MSRMNEGAGPLRAGAFVSAPDPGQTATKGGLQLQVVLDDQRRELREGGVVVDPASVIWRRKFGPTIW